MRSKLSSRSTGDASIATATSTISEISYEELSATVTTNSRVSAKSRGEASIYSAASTTSDNSYEVLSAT
jgi:hypothetical protein